MLREYALLLHEPNASTVALTTTTKLTTSPAEAERQSQHSNIVSQSQILLQTFLLRDVQLRMSEIQGVQACTWQRWEAGKIYQLSVHQAQIEFKNEVRRTPFSQYHATHFAASGAEHPPDCASDAR